MLRKYFEAALRWLKRVVTQPRDELSRWQRATRFGYDLGKFGARQLRYDRAPQMAAALAFRALFGLVPVLIVATVVVRALIGIEEFLDLVNESLSWAHLDDVTILLPSGTEAQSQSLSQWLARTLARHRCSSTSRTIPSSTHRASRPSLVLRKAWTSWTKSIQGMGRIPTRV